MHLNPLIVSYVTHKTCSQTVVLRLTQSLRALLQNTALTLPPVVLRFASIYIEPILIPASSRFARIFFIFIHMGHHFTHDAHVCTIYICWSVTHTHTCSHKVEHPYVICFGQVALKTDVSVCDRELRAYLHGIKSSLPPHMCHAMHREQTNWAQNT